MSGWLTRLVTFLRGPRSAPAPALEAENRRELEPERLDAALERLRAENPSPDDDAHEL